MLFDFKQVIVWSGNNLFRDSVTKFFLDSSLEVKPVLNLEEVFVFAQKDCGSIIFAGITRDMPNAFDSIEKLKSFNKKNRFIAVAMDSGIEAAVKAIKAGADEFLVMPDSRDEIFELCSKIMEKEASSKKKMSAEKASVPKGKGLVAMDKKMKDVLSLADRVAPSRAPVFLAGESGTGKEVIARYIHGKSMRKGPFVGVNCAALPEALLESALFGHEKGAFTGAVSRKPGKFEIADNGTLLLDEITEMPVYLQAKLLRVLQEGEVDRVGGTEAVKVDVRVIAATNKNPVESVKTGDFRNDLYHRINTIPLKIPPLRERPDDIIALAHHFIEKYNFIDGQNVNGMTDAAKDKLLMLDYSGNVRELENIIRRAVLISNGVLVDVADIVTAEEFVSPDLVEKGEASVEPAHFTPRPLREVEKEFIFKTLDETDGNRTHAAEILGISVRTLRNKLNSYKEKV
ncbi:MAG: sigma-54-dependent Fis family transcriptional regulator [Deltaproteobacteria bacterium]|nr:MAG: sigma-54-dependent Fis family transcriptional regulator [Deltaproteobacteria bacterium]